MKPAIIVVAYNRPSSLKRILNSLDEAHYDNNNIPLVISIDCLKDGSIHEEVLAHADNFIWKFGTKEIIRQSSNLGLRNHIIQCGNLTNQFESIILLEDDLTVSSNFYSYAVASIDYYKKDENIAGISLYKFNRNIAANLPFEPLYDGNDVFFMQFACSWGQIWTRQQWSGFVEWYNKNPSVSNHDKLPEVILNWPKSSWLKFFMKYIVITNKFFVYPTISHTTNFGDAGTHNWQSHNISQVQLSRGIRDYRFIEFKESMVKYDIFFEILPECLLKLSNYTISSDLCVDLYGSKSRSIIDNEFIITSNKVRGNPIQTFGLATKPLESNIIQNIKGSFFSYARASNLIDKQKVKHLELFEFLGQIIEKDILLSRLKKYILEKLFKKRKL